MDWEVKTVKDIAEIGRGRVISQVEIEKSIAKLYPVYSSQTSNGGEMGRLDSYDFDGEYVTWTTDGVNAGRVFYRNGKFNCTNVCGVLKIINESPQYAAIALNMRTCDYVATNLANPKLMNCVMKEIKLPFPPLAEQRRIAGALSDIDELILALGKLIEKKRNIKTGAIQELLGMRNEECGMRNVPRRRLAGFSGAWVEKRLGEIASFETATIGVDKMDSEWYIGTENMLAEKAGVEKNLIPVPYATVKEYKVGDVLISNIRPYLKKIWLADRDGGCSTDVLVVRTIDNRICTPMFLKMLLSDDSFFDFTMANAVGTKMPRGDKKVIVNYQVHLPTIAEQKAIAAVLSDMDAEIAALEAKRTKYESIKQGMMQELLTGKTRLKP